MEIEGGICGPNWPSTPRRTESPRPWQPSAPCKAPHPALREDQGTPLSACGEAVHLMSGLLLTPGRNYPQHPNEPKSQSGSSNSNNSAHSTPRPSHTTATRDSTPSSLPPTTPPRYTPEQGQQGRKGWSTVSPVPFPVVVDGRTCCLNIEENDTPSPVGSFRVAVDSPLGGRGYMGGNPWERELMGRPGGGNLPREGSQPDIEKLDKQLRLFLDRGEQPPRGRAAMVVDAHPPATPPSTAKLTNSLNCSAYNPLSPAYSSHDFQQSPRCRVRPWAFKPEPPSQGFAGLAMPGLEPAPPCCCVGGDGRVSAFLRRGSIEGGGGAGKRRRVEQPYIPMETDGDTDTPPAVQGVGALTSGSEWATSGKGFGVQEHIHGTVPFFDATNLQPRSNQVGEGPWP